MNMMTLWKESLRAFNKKNMSLMGLITLKTFKDMLLHLLGIVSCAIFVYVIAMLCSPQIQKILPSHNTVFGVMLFSFVLVFTLTHVVIRASVLRKRGRYYYSYFSRAAHLFIFFFFGLILLWSVTHVVWALCLIMPILSWMSLFFFDLGQRPSITLSLTKALTAALYNFPVYGVAVALSLCLYLCYTWLITIFSVVSVPPFLGLCFVQLGVIIMANFYIKWIHSQFDLYFSIPGTRD